MPKPNEAAIAELSKQFNADIMAGDIEHAFKWASSFEKVLADLNERANALCRRIEKLASMLDRLELFEALFEAYIKTKEAVSGNSQASDFLTNGEEAPRGNSHD